QIAVHYPHQVIQAFASGKRQGAHGFGFIHFAIAEYPPDLTISAVDQAPVGQVMHEARLVYGADGAYAHGSRGELPEIGHEVRVRVAGQTAGAIGDAAQFLPVMLQVSLAQSAFEESASI